MTARTAPVGQDFHALVLGDGDVVMAAGRVVSVPGRPVRLCAPAPQAKNFGVASLADPAYCEFGVDLHGADLGRLSQRRAQHGAVEGYAEVDATYRRGELTGRAQRARVPAAQVLAEVVPPCLAPPGGWPAGARDENLDLQPVLAYGAAHPGTVLMPAQLRPSRTQVLAYVLTLGDPVPVMAALRPAYGARLCVVRSRWDDAQLTRAAQALTLDTATARTGEEYAVGRGGFAPDAQLQVEVSLTRVTVRIARVAAGQPPGLVRLQPWLRPAPR